MCQSWPGKEWLLCGVLKYRSEFLEHLIRYSHETWMRHLLRIKLSKEFIFQIEDRSSYSAISSQSGSSSCRGSLLCCLEQYVLHFYMFQPKIKARKICNYWLSEINVLRFMQKEGIKMLCQGGEKIMFILIIPALSRTPSLLRAHREVLSPFRIVLCVYK
jgi:hypothetical protein